MGRAARAAGLGQGAGAFAGHGEAAPSSARPLQDGPDQAAELAGEPTEDLDPAAAFAAGPAEARLGPSSLATRDELYYAIRGLDSSHTYTRRRRQRALGRLTPVQYDLAFAPIKPQPRPDRSQARVT